ncbi:hypothetical protein FGB62_9g411 [Gracilaria domingensis]|nr:hypothetical protein FGB62_9g411 [Gracilaria domingensis]
MMMRSCGDGFVARGVAEALTHGGCFRGVSALLFAGGEEDGQTDASGERNRSGCCAACGNDVSEGGAGLGATDKRTRRVKRWFRDGNSPERARRAATVSPAQDRLARATPTTPKHTNYEFLWTASTVLRAWLEH